VLTQGGRLCDAEGNLGPDHFEASMRGQLKLFAQRQLTNTLLLGASSHAELVQLKTLKALLREQVLPESSARP
jgi:hypothetical protein